MIFNGEELEEVVYDSQDNDFKRVCEDLLARRKLIVDENKCYNLDRNNACIVRIEKI